MGSNELGELGERGEAHAMHYPETMLLPNTLEATENPYGTAEHSRCPEVFVEIRNPCAVEKNERTQLLGQRGLTLWLTGLSASGKSTIAVALEQQLLHSKKFAYRLDGDNVRFGLNKDLGFSETDRNENIRRISEVAKLFNDATAIAITSFISPYRSDRQFARDIHEKAGLKFIEVYIDAPLSVVEARDPKGLYKKARAGEIKGNAHNPSNRIPPNQPLDFTGISAPYEPPENAEIHIRTDHSSVEDGVRQIVDYLSSESLI
ncbi:unnamed protein product [Rhizoctonia solani]|uniref:Adenylyl-sulfate kinase n=1 Tax=Rhizoctonia solani TaxID=456999 RepID=A0A8H3C058_9AGAM|nr:unnamed protein product [Rhizoctonia solani]